MTIINEMNSDMIRDLFALSEGDTEKIEYSRGPDCAQFDITLTPRYDHCPLCGTAAPRIKGYVTKKISHSILNERKCRLIYHARRYVCPTCGHTYYEHNPFVFHSMKISAATVINVLTLLKDYNQTFTSVARANGISPTSAASIFDKHVDIPRKTLSEFQNWDEVYAFKSDEGKYVCALLDFKTQTPIDFLKSRNKEYLLRYFRGIPLAERKKVKVICTDLYDTYRQVIHIIFPHALHSADRFHVSQVFHRYMTALRVRKMKEHDSKSLPYYLLKKCNWVIMIDPDKKTKVNKEAKEKIGTFDINAPGKYNRRYRKVMNAYRLRQEIFHYFPELEEAYTLKEALHDFYKDNTYETAEEAINALIKQFSDSKIPEMKSFAGTLKNWRTEIINSFYVVYSEYVIDKEDGHVDLREKHMTNAIIENRNKVVKLIKNNANGYHNWERFRNRMMYVMTPDATFTLTPKEKK